MKRCPAPPSRGSWGRSGASGSPESTTAPRPTRVPCTSSPTKPSLGLDLARSLGISGEHDLFGGVVPHAFVATKAISHPLVRPDAQAPPGWSAEFGDRVRDAVLSGYTVFSAEDADLACSRLLEHGPVRMKEVRAKGGHGQTVISAMAELDAGWAASNRRNWLSTASSWKRT